MSDLGRYNYQNDSHDIKKQSLYQLNDHFSSFSTAIDFTKSNNLRLLKQSSMERHMKSSERMDFTQENNILHSNRLGSDYETMLKTANSSVSINNSGSFRKLPQYQEPKQIEITGRSKLFKGANCSSIEPVYNVKTIVLEKKSNSNYNKPYLKTNSTVLSRESMNLTPQLLSPDIQNESIRNPVKSTKQKSTYRGGHINISRNHQNTLSQHSISR